jgi:arabinose-5-phosphate isomerase
VRNKAIADAKRVIQIERKALSSLERRLNGSFSDAVDIISKCKGRVIVTGIGKSGIIAQKIVATLTQQVLRQFFCTRRIRFTVTWVLFKEVMW